MSRMKKRLESAEALYKCDAWSSSILRVQGRYTSHIIDGPIMLWGRGLAKYNSSGNFNAEGIFNPCRALDNCHIR